MNKLSGLIIVFLLIGCSFKELSEFNLTHESALNVLHEMLFRGLK